MTNTKSIVFVDELPPPAPRVRKHQAFADALRANPGRWALFRENENGQARVYMINRGSTAAFTYGAFEAKGVALGMGRYDVYVRYVGDSK